VEQLLVVQQREEQLLAARQLVEQLAQAVQVLGLAQVEE
jgi:hypothetical protein